MEKSGVRSNSPLLTPFTTEKAQAVWLKQKEKVWEYLRGCHQLGIFSLCQLAAHTGFISMPHGKRAPRPRALVLKPAGGPGRGLSSVVPTLTPTCFSDQSPLAKWFPALATH